MPVQLQEIWKKERMARVFISYVHENEEKVNKLIMDLQAHGIAIWSDKSSIAPGERWKKAIRDGIRSGDYFIACFSKEYYARDKTYMNEELTVAIEELRLRSSNQKWFIPVLLNECEVSDRDIGAGETLRDLQHVALYEDWDSGIKKILEVVNLEAPSFSEGPLVATNAHFQITSFSCPTTAKLGDVFEVQAEITNSGSEAGIGNVSVQIKNRDKHEDTQRIPLASGEKTSINFRHFVNAGGTYHMVVATQDDRQESIIEVTNTQIESSDNSLSSLLQNAENRQSQREIKEKQEIQEKIKFARGFIIQELGEYAEKIESFMSSNGSYEKGSEEVAFQINIPGLNAFHTVWQPQGDGRIGWCISLIGGKHGWIRARIADPMSYNLTIQQKKELIEDFLLNLKKDAEEEN